MYKLFTRLFRRNINNTSEDVVSSLSIEINTDNTINIICHWPDFNKDNIDNIQSIAHSYALAIHSLNIGNMRKEIINTLKQPDSDNPYNILFANNVIFELNSLYDSYGYNHFSKPIVSPLNALKLTHHQE